MHLSFFSEEKIVTFIQEEKSLHSVLAVTEGNLYNNLDAQKDHKIYSETNSQVPTDLSIEYIVYT